MKKVSDIKTLIVDDNEDLCDIIKSRFEMFNFQAFVAYSGEEAWEILANNDIDIVISDVCMSNGGGLELLDKVRVANSSHPRVYLFSGLVEFDREDIFHRGVDGFFEKPFEASALMDVARKSALDMRLRLSTPHGHKPTIVFNEKFKSINQAILDRKILLGRGGMFYNLTKDIPEEGQRLLFKFEFEEGDFKILSGMGIVRWRRENKKDGKSGIGLEFEFIDRESIDDIVDWVSGKAIVPYIPKA